MNQLEKSNIINESSLDPGFYFQSLLQEVCNKHLLSDQQIERIQLEVVELMAKEVERYTNDESSSLLLEKAQELLQSITYSIGVYLKELPDIDDKINLLMSEKITVLFYRGMDLVAAIKSKSWSLLQDLQKNRLKLNNYAYEDTITMGIPEFFHDYNIEFGAHELMGSIDYQLSNAVEGLLGVEYILEYLKRFTLENKFLKHFPEGTVNMLLLGFDKEAEHMLINIFELVLTNALGCELLGQNIVTLRINESDLIWLQNNLEKVSYEKLQEKMKNAFDHMVAELELEPEVIPYAKAAISEITKRLMNNLKMRTLGRIFVAFAQKGIEAEIFEDGIPMEDEQLRELIDRIRDGSDINDKIAMIKETVHSIADLIELLEECFYEDEYLEVFHLLSETERSILKMNIQMDAGMEGLDDYEPEKEWQKILINYENNKKK
jgi:hypothetical protein